METRKQGKSFFFFNICRVCIFINLAALSLCCDTWEVCCVLWDLSWSCVDSRVAWAQELRCTGLVACMARGILSFPTRDRACILCIRRRIPFIFFKICLFWAVLGLCCCMSFLSSGEHLLSSWGAWAPHCSGFPCCRALVQLLWHMGLAVPWHVESSRTRNQAHISCLGKWNLNHWATSEGPKREILPEMDPSKKYGKCNLKNLWGY